MGSVESIAKKPHVSAAMDAFYQELSAAVDEAIAVQQIPAPTFQEARRADYVRRQFDLLGLDDVRQDELGNVFGRLPGRVGEWPVVVSAHLDTVFPPDTDLSIRTSGGQGGPNGLLYGPGLADNAMGVAGLILLARAFKRFGLSTTRDVWLAANVAEEGLGNLAGMKGVVGRFGETSAYIVLEGGSYGHIFHQAIGVARFRIDVQAPGGHSWGDFGNPSAIHILSRLIVDLDGLTLPAQPKTTFNVGLIQGGTTVNTIAASAHCLVDVRSTSAETLQYVESEIGQMASLYDGDRGVQVNVTEVGRRPEGSIPRSHPLVSQATDALRYVGCDRLEYLAGSTDANVPLSKGFAAVCIGLATSGNTHRTDEYLDTTQLGAGLSQLLLLALAAAGLE
jgi:tripeptide aminopeptidase